MEVGFGCKCSQKFNSLFMEITLKPISENDIFFINKVVRHHSNNTDMPISR